jgi:hypothetical protein
MSLSLISLINVFPDVFPSEEAVINNDAIKQMITVNNTLTDAYCFDETLSEGALSDSYEKAPGGGGYVLYVRSDNMGTAAGDAWTPVTVAGDKLPNSKDLYLHIVKDGKNQFVCIYDLVKLDSDKLQARYGNPGQWIAAVIYSLSCMSTKNLLIHIADIEQLNDECAEINKMMAKLNVVKDDLSYKDQKTRERLGSDFEPINSLGKINLGTEVPNCEEFFSSRNISIATVGLSNINGTQVAFITDALRIYSDEVSNLINKMSSKMQRALSDAQKNVGLASNLLQAYGKMVRGVQVNVR